jgi:hypothetical protein
MSGTVEVNLTGRALRLDPRRTGTQGLTAAS